MKRKGGINARSIHPVNKTKLFYYIIIDIKYSWLTFTHQIN